MSIKYYVKKRIFLLLLIFCILILISPFILRQSSILPGEESYFHSRVAEDILNKDFLWDDQVSYSGGRPLLSNVALPFVISLFSKAFNLSINLSCIIISLFTGVLTFVFFYLLIRKYSFRLKLISSLILILSPPFLYTFTTCNAFTIPILLILLGAFLYLRKSFYSLIPFTLVPLFNPLSSLIVIIFFFFYIIKTRNKEKLPLIILLINICLVSLVLFPSLVKYGLPSFLKFNPYEFLSKVFISDLGGNFGFSIFTIIAAIFGLSYIWQKKYKNLFLYLFFILLILFSLLINSIIIYLNFFVIFLATFGFMKLFDTKWESKTIQNLTILILACGILFSGISYINNVSSSQPDQATIDSLNHLKRVSDTDDVIFSYYTKGHWISAIAKRKNVMDTNFFYAPEVNQRYFDSETLFKSRKLEESKFILEKYDISFIYITPDMKSGLVWQKPDEGLLFLLKYFEDFEKVYDKNGIEIWAYKNKYQKL